MLCTLEIHDLPSLDRQERLGPLAGEIAVKGVDAEGQHTIVPHEHSEFGQPLHPELLQRGLKRPTADTVGLEELPAVPDHGLFVVLQRREGLVLAQGVHQVLAQPGPFPGGGMGIPNVLTVQRTGRDQHGEFLDVGRQGGLTAQIRGEVRGPTTRLRAVDHNGAWAGAGDASPTLHLRLKGLLVGLRNGLACCCRDSRHLSVPSRRVLRVSRPRPVLGGGAQGRSRRWARCDMPALSVLMTRSSLCGAPSTRSSAESGVTFSRTICPFSAAATSLTSRAITACDWGQVAAVCGESDDHMPLSIPTWCRCSTPTGSSMKGAQTCLWTYAHSIGWS